jgi:hypothetical protein
LKIGFIYVFLIPVGECSISLPPSFLHFAFQKFEKRKKKNSRKCCQVWLQTKKKVGRGEGEAVKHLFSWGGRRKHKYADFMFE